MTWASVVAQHTWLVAVLPVSGARVGVYDEHEIFRLGVVACLSEDSAITVVTDWPSPGQTLDLAITSTTVAARRTFGCGLLVCAADPSVEPAHPHDRVLGVLPRGSLTAPQLLAAVHAAMAGLSVRMNTGAADVSTLDTRRREVLRLLADGASTAEISRALHCSERTVKAAITDLKRRLHARNRAHVVATGIRTGVI